MKKQVNKSNADTTNHDSSSNSTQLVEIIHEMRLARNAERAAKAKLVALVQTDAQLTDATLISALKSNGYNEKKATNMIKSYRTLPVAPAPAPAPAAAPTPAPEAK